MLGKNALTILIAVGCVILGVLLGQKVRLEWSDSPKANTAENVTMANTAGNVTTANSAEKCIDPAGREYRTVQIGDQLWMAENLAYKPPTGNYWACDNDPNNVAKYGYLYDWETAKKVCPVGWHLPSDAEWTTLTDYLGGAEMAGLKMKSRSRTGWHNNGHGTDESGFSGLPGGYRNHSRLFFANFGNRGYWWSSTESQYIHDWAWYHLLSNEDYNAHRGSISGTDGFSVRCLRN